MAPISEMPEGSPERVGRYDLLVPIASGGMATVYLARYRAPGGFEREVALKLTRMSPGSEPEATYDLIEEAKLASRIRHPNVVSVLDAGEDPSGVFLVMDYVEGDTLAGLLRTARRKERELPLAIALRVLCDGLAGLHAAHELCTEDGSPIGLVHRDFSPQNVLVGIDGAGRLSDFGIAKAIGRGWTRSGTIKGKLGYMSPEQVRGRALDRRSDVWSAGVVAWEVLTRRRLFKAPDQDAVLFKIVSEAPPRPSAVAPDIPAALDDAVARALVREPDGRTRSADELRRQIEEACSVAGITLATRSEVAAFMESGLAGTFAQRRARAAEARARCAPPPDEEPTEIEPTFVHHTFVRASAVVSPPRRTAQRSRWFRVGLAGAVVAAAFVLASRATREKRARVEALATSEPAAPSLPARRAEPPTAPPAPPPVASPPAAAAQKIPARRPQAPARKPSSVETVAPATQPRSPFRNPYEGGP